MICGAVFSKRALGVVRMYNTLDGSAMRRYGVLGWRNRGVPAKAAALLAAVVIAGLVAAPLLRAQNPAASPLVGPASPVPEWQVAAGGQRAFAVASVRRSASSFSSSAHSNIPLGPMDSFAPTGGLFSATNVPLLQYMIFAYKLRPEQFLSAQSQLPAWANSNQYDIEGRATGNPTKDEFRLMMQDLLASQFGLRIHYETQQVPVMVLVLDKPGKLGPKLRMHPEGSACSVSPRGTEGSLDDACGVVTAIPSSIPGQLRVGGRDVPLEMFAALINTPAETGVDRPVFDGTKLAGKYDFVIEWTPEVRGAAPPRGGFQSDPSGSTFQAFQKALKEQLGLKLESRAGPVQVMVIDHVEQPLPN
jgi:uncharacterized protein (TIGR03435 family)